VESQPRPTVRLQCRPEDSLTQAFVPVKVAYIGDGQLLSWILIKTPRGERGWTQQYDHFIGADLYG
jgi:hypothetical protein